MTPAKARYRVGQMRWHFRDAEVTGSESLIPAMTNDAGFCQQAKTVPRFCQQAYRCCETPPQKEIPHDAALEVLDAAREDFGQ